MRPDVIEILAGVQQALENVVLPDVQSSYARSRGRMILRMLDYARRVIEGQADYLPVEEANLRATLADARDVFAAQPDPAARAWATELSTLLDSPTDEPTSIRGTEARIERLRAALDRTISTLDSAESPAPGEALHALRGRLRAYLRSALERELALTGTRRESLAP